MKVWCVYKGPDLRHVFSTYKKAIKFVAAESGLDEKEVQGVGAWRGAGIEQYVTEISCLCTCLVEADYSISEWEVE